MDSRYHTTDQKVGGSSPSERATFAQVRAVITSVRGGPYGFWQPMPLTNSHSRYPILCIRASARRPCFRSSSLA